jgi:chloride channel 7
VDTSTPASAYLWYAGSGMFLVLLAVLLTVFVGPGASGSGVVEVMGLLNGVNYPDTIGFKTLFVKFVALVFAITGGLCIGKEGPLVHIGAIVGVASCYLPFNYSKYLQNDVVKRQMIACGAACGVAVAFGSPIGGALFAYEISKPNTFWTFSMLWRVFTATSIATFVLSILESLATNGPLSLSDSGSLKFGNVASNQENSMLDLPAGIILGAICGLMGALFIWVSIELGMRRKKYINTPIKKVLEAVFFAFVTASSFYAVVWWFRGVCN